MLKSYFFRFEKKVKIHHEKTLILIPLIDELGELHGRLFAKITKVYI
jgi:hypothetical protein